MIFDTDVLIWALRGNAKAARVIEQADAREVAVISYMELLQGARNKDELRAIKAFLADLAFRAAAEREHRTSRLHLLGGVWPVDLDESPRRSYCRHSRRE